MKCVDSSTCCASCGVAESDDIKLKPCDGCDLVRYCSDACKEDHRSEHETKCKKRAAELRDELLFRQPGSTLRGDCPICCLPIPPDTSRSSLSPCCSKMICNGCSYASQVFQERVSPTCPFCRHPAAESNEEITKCIMKRVEANDPVAMRQMGFKHLNEGEYDHAFRYWTKAAELGDADAHFLLSSFYDGGKGVEKDETKKLYHLEEGAIRGQLDARCNLGALEWNNNRNYERAVKHWMISATQGHDPSIKALKETFKQGFLEKEVLAAALRAHYTAVDATKSEQREAGEKFMLTQTDSWIRWTV